MAMYDCYELQRTTREKTMAAKAIPGELERDPRPTIWRINMTRLKTKTIWGIESWIVSCQRPCSMHFHKFTLGEVLERKSYEEANTVGFTYYITIYPFV